MLAKMGANVQNAQNATSEQPIPAANSTESAQTAQPSAQPAAPQMPANIPNTPAAQRLVKMMNAAPNQAAKNMYIAMLNKLSQVGNS